MDMAQYSKKPTPGQRAHRAQWILDTVRANQKVVCDLLLYINPYTEDYLDAAKDILARMHKSERDAILQPNGILTDDQIKLLK